MDSLTQIALGAAVGEAVAGKKAGNKAVLWGAIAGTIPDLDVVAGKFMTTVDALVFHRGMTHSILFALIISPLLGYLIKQIYKNDQVSWKRWTLLVFLGLTTHALLDCFTTWGTQLFWPFTDYRVAWKSIFVIDPLYTLPLLICMVWILFLNKNSQKRRKLIIIGLTVSSSYLLLTLAVKHHINNIFDNSFQRNQMAMTRFDTKPTPLNIILWNVTAEEKEGYYIGFYSFFDSNKRIHYVFHPKNHHLIEDYREYDQVQDLIEISDGWYTVEPAKEGIIFNDLRFGQRSGWESGEGKFVFAYHIYKENGSLIVEEEEKNFGEAKEILSTLWSRLKGI